MAQAFADDDRRPPPPGGTGDPVRRARRSGPRRRIVPPVARACGPRPGRALDAADRLARAPRARRSSPAAARAGRRLRSARWPSGSARRSCARSTARACWTRTIRSAPAPAWPGGDPPSSPRTATWCWSSAAGSRQPSLVGPLPLDGKVVRVDIDPAQRVTNAVPAGRVVGDAERALAGLHGRLGDGDGPAGRERAERWRARHLEEAAELGRALVVDFRGDRGGARARRDRRRRQRDGLLPRCRRGAAGLQPGAFLYPPGSARSATACPRRSARRWAGRTRGCSR